MTRRFSFTDDSGEHSHMTHLQCTFQFTVNPLRMVIDYDEV